MASGEFPDDTTAVDVATVDIDEKLKHLGGLEEPALVIESSAQRQAGAGRRRVLESAAGQSFGGHGVALISRPLAGINKGWCEKVLAGFEPPQQGTIVERVRSRWHRCGEALHDASRGDGAEHRLEEGNQRGPTRLHEPSVDDDHP